MFEFDKEKEKVEKLLKLNKEYNEKYREIVGYSPSGTNYYKYEGVLNFFNDCEKLNLKEKLEKRYKIGKIEFYFQFDNDTCIFELLGNYEGEFGTQIYEYVTGSSSFQFCDLNKFLKDKLEYKYNLNLDFKEIDYYEQGRHLKHVLQCLEVLEKPSEYTLGILKCHEDMMQFEIDYAKKQLGETKWEN